METSCRHNDNNICAAPPCRLAGSHAYKKDAACATPLCLYAIFDATSIACDSGENKEVKGNKKPVKMYVENQGELSTAYKNSIYLKIV